MRPRDAQIIWRHRKGETLMALGGRVWNQRAWFVFHRSEQRARNVVRRARSSAGETAATRLDTLGPSSRGWFLRNIRRLYTQERTA